jgi:hypothetical protein
MRKTMSAWRMGRALWEAKLIKLADLIDSTEDICRNDRHFAPVFLREFEWRTCCPSAPAGASRSGRCYQPKKILEHAELKDPARVPVDRSEIQAIEE